MLEAVPEEALAVAFAAYFPRSITGKRQDDRLLRALAWVKRDGPLSEDALIEITGSASEVLTNPELSWPEELEQPILSLCQSLTNFLKCTRLSNLDRPKTQSEFFCAVGERLKYLENFKPTAGDFAVEELQNAFVGLLHSHCWGKNGLPTRAEVTDLAKERLKRRGKKSDFPKVYWSKLRRKAGFGDWLPAGRAGRPSKAELDRNVKAEQECKAMFAQFMNHSGDWIVLRDRLRAALGSKSEFERSEKERLHCASNPDSENQ